MSMLWNSKTAHEATGGKDAGEWQADRVVIDSRAVKPGDLFVALKGERFDGHDYIPAALEAGASAVIADRPGEGCRMQVPDSLKALEQLGAYARGRSEARIVAVTGSVGKTSCKEMLRTALGALGETFASEGNFNNHIGAPLTLANLPQAAKFGVFELGMNHAGEIAPLSRLVRPHLAIITTVEAVHLEFFGTVEAIADAKAEIFEGVEKGGAALLNADNPQYGRLHAAAEKKGLRVLAFGTQAADGLLIDYAPTPEGCTLRARLDDREYIYTLGATGRHFALTSVAVLLAISELGLDVRQAAAALADFHEPDGRGRVLRPAQLNGARLIDDSYNASPASMRAAFAKTAEVWQREGGKGRKLAALGDMLELGEGAEALHAGLAKEAQAAGFDTVFTAGQLMRNLHDALPRAMRGAHTVQARELLPHLRAALGPGDVLLVKGSHGSRMYELAAALCHPERSEGSSAARKDPSAAPQDDSKRNSQHAI